MQARFEVIADSRDREHWLRVRRSAGIGASEVSAVLGVNEWESAYHLACVKLGRIEADDLSDNERVYWGNCLEEAIISGYAQLSGRQAVPFGLTLRSLDHPWLFATPDAFTNENATHEQADGFASIVAEVRQGAVPDLLAERMHDEKWQPLQVKNIGFGTAEHWVDGVPTYYKAQCRAEAIVCGTRACTGAALVAGQRLAWDDVERTDLSDRQIVNMTRSFWHEILAGRLPPVDGSESTAKAIHAQWPVEEEESSIELPAEWIDLADELAMLKARRKTDLARIDEIENLLKATMKEHETAILIDGSGFSYRAQKRGKIVLPAMETRVLRRTKAGAKRRKKRAK